MHESREDLAESLWSWIIGRARLQTRRDWYTGGHNLITATRNTHSRLTCFSDDQSIRAIVGDAALSCLTSGTVH